MKGHGGTGDERHVSDPWPNSPPLCAGCGMPIAGPGIGTGYGEFHPACYQYRPGTVDRPLVPDMALTPTEFRERYAAPARVHELERKVTLLECDLAALRRLVARGC